MTWQGPMLKSETPKPVELAAALKALSPRSGVVLAGSLAGDAKSASTSSNAARVRAATRYICEQGVERRRLLVLPSARGGRHRRRHDSGGEVVEWREALRFADRLVMPIPFVPGRTAAETAAATGPAPGSDYLGISYTGEHVYDDATIDV